jgi:hypothetical protein
VLLAAAYLALAPLWTLLPGSRLGRAVGPAGGFHRTELATQAGAIAQQSAAVDVRVGPRARAMAFALGEVLGFEDAATCQLSSLGSPVQPGPGPASTARREAAQALATQLGIASAARLPCRTGRDALDLSSRIDADEDGTAARIAAALSTRHREWFLFGRHIGLLEADLQSLSRFPGLEADMLKQALAHELGIVVHGTLAGADPQLIEPFETHPPATDPRQTAVWLQQRIGEVKRSFAAAPPDP